MVKETYETKFKIPSEPHSEEQAKAAWKELLKTDKAFQEWPGKDQVGTYKRAWGEFYLLTGYTPSDVLDIHKLYRTGKITEHPIAQALGGKHTNNNGNYTDYLMNVAEAWVIEIEGKQEKAHINKIHELREKGADFKIIRQGTSRGTSSNRHSGIRSLVSWKYPLRGDGLPVQNMPAYTKVQTAYYKPTMEDIRDMHAISNLYERWVQQFMLQCPLRPGDALRLIYTKDMADQEKLIETGKRKTKVITFSYTPHKTENMNVVGERLGAFGDEAYVTWQRIKSTYGLKVGDPLFPGKTDGAITQQWFTENFNRPARAIVPPLQERAGPNKKAALYSLRSVGMDLWNKGASRPNFGDYVSGHDLPGITESYSVPHVILEEYENCRKFLNPTIETLEKQASLEERVTEQDVELQKLKGTVRGLQEQINALFAGKTGIVAELMEAAEGENVPSAPL